MLDVNIQINEMFSTVGLVLLITVWWKILAGENFCEFGNLLQIPQSFYPPIACII